MLPVEAKRNARRVMLDMMNSCRWLDYVQDVIREMQSNIDPDTSEEERAVKRRNYDYQLQSIAEFEKRVMQSIKELGIALDVKVPE